MNINNTNSSIFLLILILLISCNKSGLDSDLEPLKFQYSLTHVSINNNADGAIDLTVTGGEKPYSFLWSNGDTSEDLSNLSVGIYTVTVTDNKNQSKTESTEIKKIVPLTFSLIKTDISSYGASDGSIDLKIESGISPFQYIWSNGDSTEDISNLSSGWYSVQVTDYFNQTAKDSALIVEPPISLLDTFQVNNNLFIIEEPDMGGVNISLFSNNDGVLIIDSGYQQQIENLEQNIKAITNKNITHIINTHHHDDHTGGNSLLNGGTVMGHLNGIGKYRSINPNADFIGYSKQDSINILGENIVFYPTDINGHSTTDLIIYFKKSKIVFMGDLYLSESFPSVSTSRGANVKNAISHLEFVKNAFPDAKWVVPGHGKLTNMNEFSDYIEMVKETVAVVTAEMAKGKDFNTIINENVLSDYDQWGAALPGLNTNFWIKAIYFSYLNDIV